MLSLPGRILALELRIFIVRFKMWVQMPRILCITLQCVLEFILIPLHDKVIPLQVSTWLANRVLLHQEGKCCAIESIKVI